MDIEDNTCDFNNQGFYQLLEFLSSLPESVGDEPETTIYRDKKAILLPVQIYDMDSMYGRKKAFLTEM